MTKAELRTLTRQLIEEYSTESGSRLPSDNVILDSHIDTAALIVSCVLMNFDFTSFLDSENISLTATSDYTLTADWVRIWAVQKTGTTVTVLPFLPPEHIPFPATSAADPTDWSVKGKTIIMIPTPNAVQANYARVWFFQKEADDLPDAGPTYIPSIAHRLIAIKASSLILNAVGDDTTKIDAVYEELLGALTPILSTRIMQLSPEREEV